MTEGVSRGQAHDVTQAWHPDHPGWREQRAESPVEGSLPADVEPAPAADSQDWRITRLARYLFGFSQQARADDSSGGDISSEAVSDTGSTGDGPSVEIWEDWEKLGRSSCDLLCSQTQAPRNPQQENELPRDDSSWMRASQMLPLPEDDAAQRRLAGSVLNQADQLLDRVTIAGDKPSL